MKRVLIFLLGLGAFAPLGAEQVVRLGDVACHAGTMLTVPLEVEGVKGAASVYAHVTYDPLVLAFVKAEAGSLEENFLEFEAVSDAAGSVKILTFGTNDVANLTGTLAHLTFHVREGSEGLYSDLTLAEIKVNEKTLTADLTVANPLKVRSALLRVAAAADVEVEIAEGSDVALSDEDKAGLKSLLSLGSDVRKVVVKGSLSAVELGIDLGIKPATREEAGVLTATFLLPELKIVGFEPEKELVRAKVIPSQGAQITGSGHVTGVIHVFGTSSLAEKMREIGDIEINLDGYLKAETAGEMEIRVQFGTKTFFRVVAGRVVGETID